MEKFMEDHVVSWSREVHGKVHGKSCGELIYRKTCLDRGIEVERLRGVYMYICVYGAPYEFLAYATNPSNSNI